MISASEQSAFDRDFKSDPPDVRDLVMSGWIACRRHYASIYIDPSNFEEYLTIWRKRLGITQTAMCQLLDVSPGTYGAWESGAKQPSRIQRLGIVHIIQQQAQQLK